MVTKTPCGFIDDGYTEPFDIPEVPGESVGIKGDRRPITRGDFLHFISLPVGTTDESDAANVAACELVAKHIKKWNLKNSKGKPVEITAENVSNINPPRLLANLIDLVCGSSVRYVSPDAIRTIAENTKLDHKTRIEQILSLFEGVPRPGEAEAADSKN